MNNGMYLIFNDEATPQQRINELEKGIRLGLSEDDELAARVYLGLAYLDLEIATKTQPGVKASPETTEATKQIHKAVTIDRDGSYDFFLQEQNRALLGKFDLFCSVRAESISDNNDLTQAIAYARENIELFGYLPSNPMINLLLQLSILYCSEAQGKASERNHGEERKCLSDAKSCLLEIMNFDTVNENDEGELRTRDKARDNLQTIDNWISGSTEKENEKKEGGCYIATVSYGSPDAVEVVILKRYRDNKLARSYLGRLFIRFYYSFSPYLASIMKNNQALNNIVKKYFLDKIVTMLRARKI
jgi:hypothetical protein